MVESDAATSPEEFGSGSCPSCGYYVGAEFVCPRCGARVDKRISIRLIKILSVVGSIVGVGLLWAAAKAKVPERVQVAEINEMMNGAIIEVRGKVVEWTEDADRNSLRFRVDDGTADITVSAFGKLDQVRAHMGSDLPHLNDVVSVVGSVNETQRYGVSIFLSIPERLKLVERYVIQDAAISSLGRASIGQTVRLHCRVAEYEKRTTRSGGELHRFVLDDGTGRIDMTLFDSEAKKLGDVKLALLTGADRNLELVVKIGEYRDSLQVDRGGLEDVKDLGPAPPLVSTDTGAVADTAPPARHAPPVR